jgi:hypothetical protein
LPHGGVLAAAKLVIHTAQNDFLRCQPGNAPVVGAVKLRPAAPQVDV